MEPGAAPPATGGLAGPGVSAPDPSGLRRGHAGSTLTCGHVIIWGIGEAQQKFWPLAAQLVGLVPGLQLHLCRMRGEQPMQPPSVQLPPTTNSNMMAVTASINRAGMHMLCNTSSAFHP